MRSLLVSVSFALLLIPATTSAQTFQWESLGIADEAVIPSGTFASMGCGGYAIRIDWTSFSDGVGTFVPFAGADFVSYESGQQGAHPGHLSAGFDNSQDDPDDTITITLSFNAPVEDLAFAVADVDTSSWDDGVEVFYNGGTNTKFSSFVSFSTPPVFNDNETYMEGFEGGGTSVAQTSAAGNVDFDFGAGAGVAISEIVIVYRSTDDASPNPGAQVVGITDLTFSCDNPTAVLITDVRQVRDEEATWVEWDTAWQADTAGFFIYRWNAAAEEYLPLHSDMVSALARPDGGLFAAMDTTGLSAQDAWYLVEEVRTSGESSYYGPFLADQAQSSLPTSAGDSGRDLLSTAVVQRTDNTWSQPKAMNQREVERLSAALTERSMAADAALISAREELVEARADASAMQAWVKLEVDPGTVVAVDFATLASEWGLNASTVKRLAHRSLLQLRHGGEILPYTVDGDGVVFYAREEEPKFSYTTNYWLRIGRGAVMDVVKAEVKPGTSASAVRVERKSEVDATALTANAKASEQDLYIWDLLVAGNPDSARKSFSVDVADRVPGTDLSLTLETLGVVVGASPTSQQRVQAYIGETELGEFSWSSKTPVEVDLLVQGGGLADTSIAEIDLDLVPVPGASGNLAFVDSLSVGYTRRAHADAGQLTFEAIDAGIVTVADVGGVRLIALDVTDPLTPRRLATTLDTTTSRLGIAAEAGQRFSLAHGAGIRAPLSVTPVMRGGTWREQTGAEYVVIAASELLDGANELADFRSEYSTMVVDAQELFDFYSDGAQDPGAIVRFLKYADRRWTVKPKFVVLVGGTSYDRKNVEGLSENLMPTFFARTPHGLFSTDIPFVDYDNDRVPNVAIGRIPAVTNAEVSSYVGKLQNQMAPRGGFRASLLADNADTAGDFASASSELKARFEASASVEINEFVSGQANDFKSQMQADFAAGLHWSNYFGHGSVDRVAAESLLTVDDVATLQGDFLPTMTALTCQIGRLEFPGHQSLAEALVLEDGAGAMAVWGASGLSQQSEAREIADAFVAVHAEHQGLTLGEAINATLARYSAGSPVSYMQTLYTLFGDPAADSPLMSAPLELVDGDGADDESSDTGSDVTDE